MMSYDIICYDDDLERIAIENLVTVIRMKVDKFETEIHREGGRISIDIGGNNEVAVEFDGISEELQDRILTALESQES